jgi:hypothetical protein
MLGYMSLPKAYVVVKMLQRQLTEDAFITVKTVFLSIFDENDRWTIYDSRK